MGTTQQKQQDVKGLIKSAISELGEASYLGDYNSFNTKTHDIISHLFVLEDIKETEKQPIDDVIKALDALEHIYDNELQKVIMKQESLNEVYENIVSCLQEIVE